MVLNLILTSLVQSIERDYEKQSTGISSKVEESPSFLDVKKAMQYEHIIIFTKVNIELL